MNPKVIGREDDAWVARVAVPARTLALGLRQLGQMLQAGVPILRALDALTHQPESPDLAEIWWTVQRTVGNGCPLSQALAPFKNTFPRQVVHIVRVGESTGSLVAALVRLADGLERDDLLKRRVLSALAYPVVVLLTSLLVSYALLRFVLPPFLDSLISLKLHLPWPTRLLMLLAGSMRHPFLLLGGGLLLWLGRARLRQLWRSPKLAYRLYRDCQYVPLLGRCMRDYSTIRLAAAAAQLLSSGGDVLRSWDLALRASGDPRLDRLRPDLRRHLLEGEDASAFFFQHPQVVSRLFTALLEVGENTGKTPLLLERVARNLEDELDHELTLLTSLIQPAMLMVVSMSTLFIILALFLPLYSQLMNL